MRIGENGEILCEGAVREPGGLDLGTNFVCGVCASVSDRGPAKGNILTVKSALAKVNCRNS